MIRIWSQLLKKSLIENFIFCAVVLAEKSHFQFMTPKHSKKQAPVRYL